MKNCNFDFEWKMQTYVSCDISFIKIEGLLCHGTEPDWYKCYIIWVNKATYTRTLFSSAFINNQYYIRNVLSENVSTKNIQLLFSKFQWKKIRTKLTANTSKNYFSLGIDIMDFFPTLECKITTFIMLITVKNTQLGIY